MVRTFRARLRVVLWPARCRPTVVGCRLNNQPIEGRTGWTVMMRTAMKRPWAAWTGMAPPLQQGAHDVQRRINATPTATAPPTPFSTAMSRETMTTTMTITMMTTTIALPAMIELMGVTVLVPHLARCRFNIVVVVTMLSCAVHKRADACAFKRAFVLGQGRRDDGANNVIVGNSGSRGDVQRSRRGAEDTEGDADVIIC